MARLSGWAILLFNYNSSTMKRLFLLFAAIGVAAVSQAQGLSQVVVEVFDPTTLSPAYVAPAGRVTYRVYAELQSANDRLVEIKAERDCSAGPTACVDCTQLLASTTTTFFNSTFGGSIGSDIQAGFFGFVPDLAADSWFTINRPDNTGVGTLQSIGDVVPQLAAVFGNAATSSNFVANDGAIFSTPDQPNTLGTGPNNRVLLAQFSTDGELSFGLNLSVQPGGVAGTPFTIYTHDACYYALNEQFGITYVTEVPSLTYPAAVAVDGCTDSTACNYNVEATNDDGSCIFPGASCDDGDATTINDVLLADCSCAGVTVPGCIDPTACNVDPNATVDDGSCIFPGDSCDDGDATTVGDVVLGDCSCAGVQVPGCTALSACNYDSAATVDNGSCIFPGDACDDGDATTVGDVVLGDCSCAGVQVPGCTALSACNYDSAATVDNGSCIFPGDSCDDGDALTEGDTIDGSCNCVGTPVPLDCLGVPNGTALPGTACDDGDATTENDVYQADCSCAGTLIVVPGCTDSTACNYNPAANQEDGSCASLDCNGECGGSAVIDGCGDCVGGSTGNTAGVPGCTDPAANNYNASATCDDSSCVFSTLNDIPAFASVLDVEFIGTCSSVAGDVDQASVVAPEASATATAGLWYRFTAVTAGARVSVETADFDAVVELQDALHNVIDIEDVNLGNGNEVLNIGSLTAGDDYFVRVAPASATSGAAQFGICVEWLPDTEVDRAAGVTNVTRSLCQNSKADWVVQGGSNYSVVNYIFTFSNAGFEVTTETGAAFTIMPLSNVSGLMWEGQYDVAIDVELVLADGSGASENVVVQNTTAVGLTITAPPSTNLRPADNLTNAGPLFPSALIFATPFVCTVDQWEWEFTNAAGGLPIPFISPNFDRRVRLSDVEGLMPGEVYNVRVRPLFDTGYQAPFGAVDQIAIIGAIGMAPEIESPVVVDANDAERAIEFNGAELALYPNPNNGEFVNINLSNVNSDVERIAVDIYDSFGKLVISRQIANAGSQFNVIMPLDGIAAGVYTVSIILNDEVRTERMIVQR